MEPTHVAFRDDPSFLERADDVRRLGRRVRRSDAGRPEEQADEQGKEESGQVRHRRPLDDAGWKARMTAFLTASHLRTLAGLAAVLVAWVALVRNPTEGKDEPKKDQPPAAPRGVVAIINRGGCGNCHVIPGVPGADGEVGPDLTTLGKVAGTRKPKTTAKEYVRESILDPDAYIAPGGYEKGVMPKRFGKSLSEDDLGKLVDYLASLCVEAPKGKDGPRPKLVTTRPAEATATPFAPLLGKAASDEQIVLGKYLFFDRRLPASNALSCASCHRPDKAFSDDLPVSIGYPGTALFRNTPTLLNVSRVKTVYWDGRLSGADPATVVRDHLTEPFFMAADGRLLIERMKQVPEYVELFKAAYKSEPDFGTILKALAAYVGSLGSPPAPFDLFFKGDEKALNADAVAGKKLFEGKAGCATCHPAPLFTDHKFYDLGLRADPNLLEDPERHITFRRFFRGLGTPNYRNLTEDAGRYVVRFNDADWGKFRTPSLREVGRTAPYMHDGRFKTLDDVIDFYDRGGGKGQQAGLKPLKLDADERRQLVAFLKSLSGETIKVVVPELPDYKLMPLGKDEPMPAPDLTAPVVARKSRPITPLPAPPQPKDNPTTKEKVELGRLVGFTRIMSPRDFDNAADVPPEQRARISRKAPTWLPASETRGEGIFFQFSESLVQDGSSADLMMSWR